MSAVLKLSGTALAAVAAGLLLAGCATGGAMDKSGAMMEQSSAMEAKVHCAGVNACKGQTACKSASNDCKGQNSCKGKGFLALTKPDCTAKGGTVI